MTKDECWQKFSQTGCIADYLAYASFRKEPVMQQTNSREDYSNTYAGFGKCDGADIKGRTDR